MEFCVLVVMLWSMVFYCNLILVLGFEEYYVLIKKGIIEIRGEGGGLYNYLLVIFNEFYLLVICMFFFVYIFFMYVFYVIEMLFCVDFWWFLLYNGIGIDLRFRIFGEVMVFCFVVGDI